MGLQQPAVTLVQGAMEPQPERRQRGTGPDLWKAGTQQASVCCYSTACCRNSENRVQFLKYFFFLRGFHEDTRVCPCCSLQATAVNSTSCKTCCSQVSISHLQQWPGRSVSGGVSARGRAPSPALSVVCALSAVAGSEQSRSLLFIHCFSS